MSHPAHGDAGAAGAAPASSSPDVLDAAARVELDRIRRRWSELSLSRAQEAAPDLRAVVEEVAALTGDGDVPDLGPGVLADQLSVVVWDACAAGRGDGIAETLTDLRRALP